MSSSKKNPPKAAVAEPSLAYKNGHQAGMQFLSGKAPADHAEMVRGFKDGLKANLEQRRDANDAALNEIRG